MVIFNGYVKLPEGIYSTMDGLDGIPTAIRTDHGDPRQFDHWVAWCQLIPTFLEVVC